MGGPAPAGGMPVPLAPVPLAPAPAPYAPSPVPAVQAAPMPPAPPPVWQGIGSRPLFGTQTGFVQVRQPAFWLFAGLLAVTALLTLSDQARIVSVLPTAYFTSWFLLAVWVVPVVAALYVLDIYEREPVSLLLAAFGWGAIVATQLAIPTNTAMLEIVFKLFGPQTTNQWGPALAGPPIEETLKYSGVVLIFLIARAEIDDIFDGFIYGAMVGLGFATVENVQYFIGAAAGATGDQAGAVFGLYLLRVVFSGPYMHVLWTGLSGAGLAYAVTRTDLARQRRILVAAGMFAVGVSAHFFWNSPFLNSLLGGNPGPVQMLMFGLIKGLPFLGFLVALVFLSQRREARWFEGAVAAEVGAGTITADDVATITDIRRRWRARRVATSQFGPTGGKLVSRLQHEEIALAMIRARVRDESAPELLQQRAVIRGLKADLTAAMAAPRPVPAPALPPIAQVPQPLQSWLPPTPIAPAPAPVQPAPAPVQLAPVQPAPASVPVEPGPSTPEASAPAAAPVAPAAAAVAQPAVIVAQPAAVAQPAPSAAAQPAPPPPPTPPALAWAPSHHVPDAGMLAWPAPDPRYPPMVNLAPHLDLRVLEWAGAWARVVASNGWSGWVDGRQLVPAPQ